MSVNCHLSSRALIRTNINVQELTVRALMTENREHIYHAAMIGPPHGSGT